MKTISRSTVTYLDGMTFHEDNPPWIKTPVKGSVDETPIANLKPNLRKNIYYESLKLIFLVLTMTGTLPVFRLKIASHKIQVLVCGGICLSVYVLFAYLSYSVTVHILRLILHDDDFSSVTIQVTLMMLLTQHVFYFLLTWPESIAVNRYLVRWREFETQFKLVVGSELKLNCRNKIALMLMGSTFLAAIYPHFLDRIDDKSIKSKTDYLVISYHIFIQLCFYTLWFSNGSAIMQASRQYYQHLARECAADITADRLEDYRLVWMRLTQLVRDGSSMLSYTMAFMVTTPFAYEVIAAYNLTIYVIQSIQSGDPGDSAEAIATGLTFLFYGSLLYMFCNSGHCMTTECERVQEILFVHNPKSHLTQGRVNNELRLFLRCVRSVPPLATLSGYVTINRKVFLHLTGVLVTYLIILVQFNISSIHNGKKSVTEQI
ncbi:gustatory and odorant receptor 63a-like [Macrosteles quadrilineatus]|uniref:gustatory and odorant receptor 63a-like n=1 Tax=Macrosteles quadrilineatus TaxID=74068 RepID=UPI0023E2651A|nr:gustatory and odorant receptor 63a-like [Macrosteles quadrilineatus]